MRHQSKKFVEKFLKEHPTFPSGVLDVGSLDVSGNIRHLFNDKDHGGYLGVDMRDGNNVDVVVNGHDLSFYFKGRKFGLVICFDTLEHDEAFWLTIREMKRVLARGGWLIIGVPSRACALHEHPQDYWRFMKNSFDIFFAGMEEVNIEVEMQGVGYLGRDMEAEIYGWGKKK